MSSNYSLSHIESRRLSQLLEAVLSVGSDLDQPAVLKRIVESAAFLVDARYGALGVLNEESPELAQFITSGLDDADINKIGPFPKGHGILGLLIAEPRPLRIPNLSEHVESYGFPPHHPPMRSFLGVPIRLRNEVFGNLYLTDKTTAPEFTKEDEAIVVALAHAAAIAIENARLHSRVREATLTEDRERIARDLHDTVIQRLFATGLSLQSIAARIEPAEAAERVQVAASDLDDTITQIRTTIFELQTPHESGGFRSDLLQLARDSERMLKFTPNVNFSGPLDTSVNEEIATTVMAVLREALANTARHARATKVDITATLSAKHLTITVLDDGVGFETAAKHPGNGLRNLARRAQELKGDLNITSTCDGGTILRWRVPVTS